MTDNVFPLFHRYNRLARRGYVKYLTHFCGQQYTFALGENDSLVLRCTSCDETVIPGQKLIDTVEAVVKEHYE